MLSYIEQNRKVQPFYGATTLSRGAQKLTGENLKIVWAEFFTLSLAVLLLCKKCMLYTHAHI
jgi:hypothetical protein